MIKSSIKIITAGMVGGLLSFGLTATFKPNIPLQISKTNNQPNSTERKNENISQGNYSIPVIMPAFESDVSFTTAAEKTVNSVVHVTTQYEMASHRDPFSELFYGGGTSTQIATGSGVIISDDGYIVTNNHVVDGADKIEITLNNERTYTAAVIGKDPNTDLALLKINENSKFNFRDEPDFQKNIQKHRFTSPLFSKRRFSYPFYGNSTSGVSACPTESDTSAGTFVNTSAYCALSG